MVVYVLFCIFLLLLTEIECFLCMFAGNLREFIYMGISDEKLWESCLKGDKEAFRELYCRFYALLRNYGIKLLPDKNLVEDCVQDIFINLIQNHTSLSPTANVRGYLLKALRHKLYDTIEKNRKMEDVPYMRTCFKWMSYSPVSHWIRQIRTTGLNF